MCMCEWQRYILWLKSKFSSNLEVKSLVTKIVHALFFMEKTSDYLVRGMCMLGKGSTVKCINKMGGGGVHTITGFVI